MMYDLCVLPVRRNRFPNWKPKWWLIDLLQILSRHHRHCRYSVIQDSFRFQFMVEKRATLPRSSRARNEFSRKIWIPFWFLASPSPVLSPFRSLFRSVECKETSIDCAYEHGRRYCVFKTFLFLLAYYIWQLEMIILCDIVISGQRFLKHYSSGTFCTRILTTVCQYAYPWTNLELRIFFNYSN